MAAWLSIRRGLRRRPAAGFPVAAILLVAMVLLSIILFIYNFVWSTGSFQAKKAVNLFYEREQSGDFGSAWELFHSQMKAKFPKEEYIQLRARVYMQQLGAQTFGYKVEGTDKIGAWSMGESSPAIADVYRMTVTQQMMSVFGDISIRQDVYAAQENGEWKLLWSYQED